MEKKRIKSNINELYAYWQCPNCNIANMDIVDNFLLQTRKFKCIQCGKEYSLKKKFVQVLCQPLEMSSCGT